MKKQLVGKEVRVFGKEDSPMFDFATCELVAIASTYIIVLLDKDEPEGGYFTLVPLAEISSIDTIPETIKENNNESH